MKRKILLLILGVALLVVASLVFLISKLLEPDGVYCLLYKCINTSEVAFEVAEKSQDYQEFILQYPNAYIAYEGDKSQGIVRLKAAKGSLEIFLDSHAEDFPNESPAIVAQKLVCFNGSVYTDYFEDLATNPGYYSDKVKYVSDEMIKAKSIELSNAIKEKKCDMEKQN